MDPAPGTQKRPRPAGPCEGPCGAGNEAGYGWRRGGGNSSSGSSVRAGAWGLGVPRGCTNAAVVAAPWVAATAGVADGVGLGLSVRVPPGVAEADGAADSEDEGAADWLPDGDGGAGGQV